MMAIERAILRAELCLKKVNSSTGLLDALTDKFGDFGA